MMLLLFYDEIHDDRSNLVQTSKVHDLYNAPIVWVRIGASVLVRQAYFEMHEREMHVFWWFEWVLEMRLNIWLRFLLVIQTVWKVLILTDAC